MSRLRQLIKELCPDGVELKNLEDCCFILDSKRKPVTKAYRQSGEFPYYGANGIQDYVSDYIFDGTYVLVGEDGSVMTEVGTPVVTWASGKIWVNNHAHIIAEKKGISLRYLYHYIQTVNVKPLIHGNIPKLTGADFRAIKIPVPPLEVQREIVRILDNFTELTAELASKLTAELTARQTQYEFYRGKLLSFDVRGDGIEWRTLDEVANFSYGYTATAANDGDVRIIRITDIMENGTLNPHNAKYVSLSTESKKYLLHEGDILVARTGATYGKTLYYSESKPAVYASFLIKLTLDNRIILNRYYWHFAQSTLYWDQAQKLVSTGGQPQFNANALRRIKIGIPPLEIQKQVVAILDKYEIICSDLSIGLPAEIAARQKQYEYYRDKLLSFPVKVG